MRRAFSAREGTSAAPAHAEHAFFFLGSAASPLLTGAASRVSAMSIDPLDCALDLMRRLPPSQTEDNLSGCVVGGAPQLGDACGHLTRAVSRLIDLVPDLVEDLLSAVDQPLKVAHDKVTRERGPAQGVLLMPALRVPSATTCCATTIVTATRIAHRGPTSMTPRSRTARCPVPSCARSSWKVQSPERARGNRALTRLCTGNNVFDIYREMYFDGGVSSMYAWDLDAGTLPRVGPRRRVLTVRQDLPLWC